MTRSGGIRRLLSSAGAARDDSARDERQESEGAMLETAIRNWTSLGLCCALSASAAAAQEAGAGTASAGVQGDERVSSDELLTELARIELYFAARRDHLAAQRELDALRLRTARYIP